METCKYNKFVGCNVKDGCDTCEVCKVYEQGRADAIEELYDLTEKAIKHQADNFIQFGNGYGRRIGRIMGVWLFEYFLEMKIEAEKILKQLKEKKCERY